MIDPKFSIGLISVEADGSFYEFGGVEAFFWQGKQWSTFQNEKEHCLA